MCGIAGVISWSEKYRVTRELLQAVSAKIAHRGPDGEGFFLTRENEEIDADHPQAGFAFRRLAVLDPDPRAMQPFTIGAQTIVFNGEIYNFRELRAELAKLRPDYSWRTTGDTEVLLLSYATWGEKCPEKLNGMFAFAVWDEEKKELFLARDRMGQKPLYVAGFSAGDSFPATDLRMDHYGAFSAIAFASEIPSLLQCPWITREIDPTALAEYLRFGCTRWTFFNSIGCIDPGHASTIRRDAVNEIKYFEPSSSGHAISDADARTKTRALLSQAVERQLVSDVPSGVFLSGGIDSSIVAACARQRGPVETFSIAFDDPRYDESSYAIKVSKHLGTSHHVFRVTPNTAVDLPVLAAVFGTPFGDSSALPTHYLARETRKYVKVALSGDGGDELFGGYDRYRALSLGQRLSLVGRRLARFGRFAQGKNPKSPLSRAGRLLGSLDLPTSDRYESYVRLMDEATVRAILAEPLAFQNRPICFPVASLMDIEMEKGREPAPAAAAVDRITYLPDDLLTKVDRASMLHALEVRSPFMDHELVQFATGLTTDQLTKGGPKRMLREAFAGDLPDFVFKRKKMGFAVPIGDWLRKELRPMLHDHLFASDSFARGHFNLDVVRRLIEEHESHRVDHSQRLYALLMLELWHRAFNRGTM